MAAPPTEASKYTLFTRPISGSGVASCRAVVDTMPHTTAWTPNTAMVAPATHGLRVSARIRWTVVSITRPARSRVSEPTRGSSRWYAGMPKTAPIAPTDTSSPNCVSLSPSRPRANSTQVANAAQKVMFMTRIEHASVRTPAWCHSQCTPSRTSLQIAVPDDSGNGGRTATRAIRAAAAANVTASRTSGTPAPTANSSAPSGGPPSCCRTVPLANNRAFALPRWALGTALTSNALDALSASVSAVPSKKRHR